MPGPRPSTSRPASTPSLPNLSGSAAPSSFTSRYPASPSAPSLTPRSTTCATATCLVVTKLDRLARSVPDLLAIIERVRAKQAAIEIGNLGTLDDTATGKLMITVLGAIAAFEREMMLERQREGIAAAKAAGKYKGRAPTARAQADEVHRLVAEGVNKSEIARRLNMHRASVHRILAANGETANALPAA